MPNRSPYLEAVLYIACLMRDGATPERVALAVNSFSRVDVRTYIALSHEIEDKAHDGTFAAAVFDILCGA